MPELPEVETVRTGLDAVLTGRRLAAARALRPNLRLPLPERFAERLTGRRVVSVTRRAKYLLLALDDGWVLLAHLGMSGRMTIAPLGDVPLGRHDHVVLDTEDGRRVTFNDARRFGLMDLVPASGLAAHPLLRGLGPEPLEDAFTGAVLGGALSGRRTAIKVALLDQRLVAGIGNIYASEALFDAAISPLCPAGDIGGLRAERLVGSIKSVLARAIAAGGSSLRDHRQPSGELGYFQHAFTVYGRDGRECPRCHGQASVLRLVQGGRATYYCPVCQAG